ncbi:MAG: ferrous iron transport protein A [Porticoccaceae bacterium]|jgi:Fe2+ transport system protein FeoA|nr:MAG: iron transporter FeoA [SAR92 bacterium BACL16 MAG-120619-bin48]KRP21708.1 MAG: iron transporter FeoA [SAR92 bacterium BACL16 MAG-120322-bin99]MDO7636293.1 ferrous iron transport protein A [Porticoccaceae bacterium]MDP4745376.1 ferrous iron transport protein A [Porticoccaceae bacterium]MDP4752808.1 ferrous iron transport protein A [Porticoccaceae bacterium]
MTLWDLKQGTSATVASFVATLESSYRVRLMELGFHPGETIACVLAPSLGAPKLYRVNNTVYSLDDSVASLIMMG